MALLFLDLDNFKIVNDTLGHKTGDILLKQASSRLSGVVRESDYICRIGGDEFAIIVENIEHVDDTSVVTAKCIECLSRPFVFDGKNFFIGVSIGVSACPDDAITANDLLVNADMAMYAAKLNGKNNCQHFHQEMNIAHSKKYQLESDLRYAIEQDQFEFRLYSGITDWNAKMDFNYLPSILHNVKFVILCNIYYDGRMYNNSFESIPIKLYSDVTTI